jgi:hypothetical protein
MRARLAAGWSLGATDPEPGVDGAADDNRCHDRPADKASRFDELDRVDVLEMPRPPNRTP